MREIKYRAWDTHRKKMWSAEEMGQDQLTLMPDGRGFVNVSGDSTRLSQFCTHLIPLEYTGLKDKNGKEIYEGDIIKGIYNRLPQNWRVNGLSAYGITFTRITIPPVSSPYFYREMRHSDQWEVIGNIYENPEIKEF